MALLVNTNTDPATSVLTYRHTLATVVQTFPTLVNTVTSVPGANGTTAVFVTSPTLQPGSYLVGGGFSGTGTAGNQFSVNDGITFKIGDTPGSVTNVPQTIVNAGYEQIGTGPFGFGSTLTGIITLTTASTLSWSVQMVLASNTGKAFMLSNGWYWKIA